MRGEVRNVSRVLVVDDDAGVRFTLREMLRSIEGVEVEQAEDGVAALEKLSTHGFELIITDLRMPRMDGMELVRRLSTMPHAPRVIVITAHGSERFAVEAVKAGAYDYFRKPFDVDELLAVVTRALESVRLRHENERLTGSSTCRARWCSPRSRWGSWRSWSSARAPAT